MCLVHSSSAPQCQPGMQSFPNVFLLVSRSTASDSHEEGSQHEHDVFGVECQETYNSVKEKEKKNLCV